MRIRNGQDLATAVLFIAIGVMGLWIGADYPKGTPQRPGTGVLPAILSWCMIGTGLLLLLQSVLSDFSGAMAGLMRSVLVLIATAAATYAVFVSGFISPVWAIVPICLGAVVLCHALELPVAWRPFFAVVLAVIAFGLMIDEFGLVITMIVSLTLCALGTAETRWLEYAGFLAVMIVIGWVMFIWLLGMPIPTWPAKLPGFLAAAKS